MCRLLVELGARPVGIAKGVCVTDAVAPGERRGDEGQELVADVRPARRPPEVKVLVDQLALAQAVSEDGRQKEPRVSDQAIVVEGHVESVNGVG